MHIQISDKRSVCSSTNAEDANGWHRPCRREMRSVSCDLAGRAVVSARHDQLEERLQTSRSRAGDVARSFGASSLRVVTAGILVTPEKAAVVATFPFYQLAHAARRTLI